MIGFTFVDFPIANYTSILAREEEREVVAEAIVKGKNTCEEEGSEVGIQAEIGIGISA